MSPQTMGVQLKACLKCNECCWNSVPTLTVIFSAEEMEAVKAYSFEPKPKFLPFKEYRDVFTIPLSFSSKKGQSRYACPFYNQPTHLCQIYPIRPFDCQNWPYFFARGKTSPDVFLNCYDGWCPEVAGDQIFDPIRIETLLSPPSIAKLIRYPGLIWEYSDAQPFRVIQNVTGLL